MRLGLSQESFYEKIETNSSASARQKSQEGNYWDTFINLSLIMINVTKNLKHPMDLEVFIQ